MEVREKPAVSTLAGANRGIRPAGTTSFSEALDGKTPMSAGEAAAWVAHAWEAETGRPPSRRTVAILWSQWALETGRGRSMRGNNFGGIKGHAPDGGSAVFWTREGHGATEVRIRSRFRVYATPEAGARDWVRVLNERYPAAFEAAANGDARGFVQRLAERRYFTASPAEYERSVTRLVAEFERAGPVDGPSRLEDPGPFVEAVIWTLARAIQRRA